MAEAVTHEVLNQPDPLAGVNLFDTNRALRDALRFNAPQLDTASLARLGALAGSAQMQVHARLAPPLMTLAFALLAVPLARSTPRQARYGPMLMGFLAYLVSVFLARLGTNWLADGKIAGPLGLWWMLLPLLAVALWLYFRDGRVRAPRLLRRAAA